MKTAATNLTKMLVTAVDHYEKSAPTVAAWMNDLYTRIGDNPESVSLLELLTADRLRNSEWMHPNYAANMVYKMKNRLGMSTVGDAGF